SDSVPPLLLSPPLFSYLRSLLHLSFFFFNDPPPSEIYPLSLHDALPISSAPAARQSGSARIGRGRRSSSARARGRRSSSPSNSRSEEHTSELQSLTNLVCRLLLEKKKKT